MNEIKLSMTNLHLFIYHTWTHACSSPGSTHEHHLTFMQACFWWSSITLYEVVPSLTIIYTIKIIYTLITHWLMLLCVCVLHAMLQPSPYHKHTVKDTSLHVHNNNVGTKNKTLRISPQWTTTSMIKDVGLL